MTNQLITGEKFGEERDAPRAHLLAEAQKPFSELRGDLDKAQETMRAALNGVTDAQSRFTPSTGEGEDAWGIAQIIRQVAPARFASWIAASPTPPAPAWMRTVSPARR